MDCTYCRRIARWQPDYPVLAATFDVQGDSPRCRRHWRYVCELCEEPSHFAACAFCPERGAIFCRACALAERAVRREFWGWSYGWERRCPFCADWHPALDLAEARGQEPPPVGLSSESVLTAPRRAGFVPVEEAGDEVVAAQWNRNARCWCDRCGPQGDLVRRLSDPVLFRLLEPLHGLRVLDAGCGEGYLARLLARRGAAVTGLEIAPALVERARAAERREPQGIRYLQGSVSEMSALGPGEFDALVSNNVLMYCPDAAGAVAEFARVLRPQGRAVLVFTHPCFWGPGTDSLPRPADSPRPEECLSRSLGGYRDRRPHRFSHPGYEHPLTYFPRTLGDYFGVFRGAGFEVTDLIEPSPEDAGDFEFPPGGREQLESLPVSILFALRLSGSPRSGRAPSPKRPRSGAR